MKRAAAITAVLAAAIAVLAGGAGAADDRGVGALIAKLDAANPFAVRLQAALLLGKMGDGRAVVPLIHMLRDNDYVIRGSAAIALGNLGDSAAVTPLILLLKDNEELVRKEAANALIKLSATPAVAKDIVAAFKGGDLRIRAGISAVLAGIRNEEALMALGEALGDDVGGISDTVARVILGMEKERAARILIKTMASKDQKARVRAIRLTMQVKTPEFIEPLSMVLGGEASGEESRAAREALKSMRQFIKSADLVAACRSDDMTARDVAVQMMGISADETAIRTLIDLLSDESVYFRGRAAQSLAIAGDKRAIPKLEKLLKDKTNQRIADIIRNSIKILEHTD